MDMTQRSAHGTEDGPRACAVHDKWNGELLAELPVPDLAELDEVMSHAEAASRTPWPALERATSLRRAVELLNERAATIQETMVSETGFTRRDAADEIDRARVTLGLCAEEATRLDGEVVPIAASRALAGSLAFTIRVPVGVVLAITPFNSPLNGPSHKVGPAIAGGNAVLLKPSALTPLTAMHLAQLLWDGGVPRERLHVVVGPGETVAMPLLGDSRVAFTTFTGSTEVGGVVKQETGVRPCSLELGNVSATIVCADADLDLAIPAILRGAFRKAGQVCTSVQRLYVHRSIHSTVVDRLIEATARLRVGDPRADSTDVGPVITNAAAERIERLIDSSVAHGAAVAVGGTRSGSLLSPTVLTRVVDGSPIVREEAFGPVLGVLQYNDLDEVIARVNANEYGLQAGIFTRSIENALTAASALEVGGVIVNGTSSTRADGMPFGGQKSSGYGKEGPRRAIRDMTVERLVLFVR